MLLVSVCFLAACTGQSANDRVIPDPNRQSEWEQASIGLFLNEEFNPDVVAFAENLNTMLISSNSENLQGDQQHLRVSSEPKDLTPPESNWSTKLQVPSNPAALERLKQRFKLHLLHQFMSFQVQHTNRLDIPISLGSDIFGDYKSGLAELSQDYPVLVQGDFQIYAADNAIGVLAYSRRSGPQRAYIAYNLSFDIHEIPLPFGFMSSTKVSLWESDVGLLRTFVTSSPLLIRPLTAVIVLVG